MRNLVLACTALLLAGGCGNTADGLKKDAEINGQKASVEGQAMSKKGGEVAKDLSAATVLTPKVKLAIDADKKLNDPANRIDVDSDDHTVTLKGHVARPGLKELAGSIAAKVLKENKAHQKLVNDLEIKG